MESEIIEYHSIALKLRDVLPGQQFYHIGYNYVAIRVLNNGNKLTNRDGTIPHLPHGQVFINAGMPDDEVKV